MDALRDAVDAETGFRTRFRQYHSRSHRSKEPHGVGHVAVHRKAEVRHTEQRILRYIDALRAAAHDFGLLVTYRPLCDAPGEPFVQIICDPNGTRFKWMLREPGSRSSIIKTGGKDALFLACVVYVLSYQRSFRKIQSKNHSASSRYIACSI